MFFYMLLTTYLDQIDGNEEGDGLVLQQRYPWEGSDRDYEYEEV